MPWKGPCTVWRMAVKFMNSHRIAEEPSRGLRSCWPRCSRAWAFAFMVPCTMLASCREGVLDPHGPIGLSEKVILFDATAIMLAVVIPVIALTLAFAWWFRAGNRSAQYKPDWQYSGRIELIIWAIPALLIAFLGGMAWISAHDLDPPKPLAAKERPVEIEVVSLDWRWLFIYPDQGIATVNQLTVPAGVPIHFRLTSTSVMNSFFIPQLGSQIYTMPGMTTQLNLLADESGTYKGLSAQFSGAGFSDMRFELVATSAEQYQQWLGETRARGGALDKVAFASLSRPSHAAEPLSFGQVDPELFNIVANGKIATRWSPEEAR
jgi:cytochrome o ubiquinol oxidase subunit II